MNRNTASAHRYERVHPHADIAMDENQKVSVTEIETIL